MDKIVSEALQELKDYSHKLIPAIENTVEHFRKQREDQALNLLVPIIEGFQWSFEVAFRTKDTLTGFDIKVDIDKINQISVEISQAIENQDYVLLADLLEHEFLPIFNNWQQGLGSKGGFN